MVNLRGMSTLAERFKQAMKKAGMKPADVERHCNASITAVCAWRDGKNKRIRPENLFPVARALSVSAEWLGTGVGPMSTKESELSGELLEAWRNADERSKAQALHALNFNTTDPEDLTQAELDIAMPRETAMKAAGLSSGSEKRAKKFDPIAEKAQSARRSIKSKRSTRKSGDPQQADFLDDKPK